MAASEIQPISYNFEPGLFQDGRTVFPDRSSSQEYSPQERDAISKIISEAPSVIGEIMELPGNENRTGGCLVIWKTNRSSPLMFEVGTMTKPDKYPVFAMVKASLLRDFLPSTQLSGENLLREPGQRYKLEYDGKQYDIPHGAVKTDDGWIISFSGFEQEWDAAGVLKIAVDSDLMSINKAQQIAEESVQVSPERTIGGCFRTLMPQQKSFLDENPSLST